MTRSPSSLSRLALLGLVVSVAAPLSACPPRDEANTDSVDLPESGLVALTFEGSTAKLVEIDPETGVTNDFVRTSSFAPGTEIGAGSLDPVTNRYAALVGDDEHVELLVLDWASGAFSTVPSIPCTWGLSAHVGTGSFFCISDRDAAIDDVNAQSGAVAQIATGAGSFYPETATSSGSDRYFFIGGSDGGDGVAEFLRIWDTATGTPTTIELELLGYHIGAQFDSALGKLFMLNLREGVLRLTDMDTSTGAMTEVATLPITPWTSAPSELIETQNVAYDSATHRYYVIVHGNPDEAPQQDQLFVIDTVSGAIVSSPTLLVPSGSLSALQWKP